MRRGSSGNLTVQLKWDQVLKNLPVPSPDAGENRRPEPVWDGRREVPLARLFGRREESLGKISLNLTTGLTT
jgi:hypothetical protein